MQYLLDSKRQISLYCAYVNKERLSTMGWFTRYGSTPSSWKAEILGDYSADDSLCKVVDHKTTCFGRHWWVLFEYGNKRFICLYLFSNHGGDWGYKDMCESMGPCYYDCPMSLIDKATDTDNNHAAKWRENVREYHAQRCARRIERKTNIRAYHENRKQRTNRA